MGTGDYDLTPGSWEKRQLEVGTLARRSSVLSNPQCGCASGVPTRGHAEGQGHAVKCWVTAGRTSFSVLWEERQKEDSASVAQGVGVAAPSVYMRPAGSGTGEGESLPAVEAPSPAPPRSIWSSDVIPLQSPQAARRRPRSAGKALLLHQHPEAWGTSNGIPGSLRTACNQPRDACAAGSRLQREEAG